VEVFTFSSDKEDLKMPSIRTDKWTKRFIGLYILGFTMAMVQTAWIIFEIRKAKNQS